MLQILIIHGRQHFCLLFLVGILCFTTDPSFSISCSKNDQIVLNDMHPGCTNYYNHTYFLDCCTWPGISCSNFTGRISGLDLFLFFVGCPFVGDDPSQTVSLDDSLVSLGDLVSLDIDLSQVYFTKGFQCFISSFPNLRHLSLRSYYDVQGIGFPLEIGNLTKLETLEVLNSGIYSDSTLYPQTLSMLSRLTSLKRLHLPYVNLSQAKDWLHVVSNLPHLEHLDLSYCNLPHVRYPSHLSVNSSKSLTYIDLSFNNLEASSSWYWVFNHSSVISLFISDSQLSGSIPNRFKGMTSLSNIDLSNNMLEGRLPSSFRGLCGLRSLDVSLNHRLQGDLPNIFQSLSCANESLAVLSLHRNLFSGSLPDFTNFRRLSTLRLHSNRLNGSLPSYFKRPSSLVIFDIHNNQLTGSVPDLSALRALKVLKFQNNKLDGSVHSGLGQLTLLRHLDMSSNSLKGDLGISHLRNLTSLRHLDISFNSLNLSVGSNWVPPFRLHTIGLASCGLGTRFPEWLQTQRNYINLDMSNAEIFDTIPFWFWNLSSEATFIGLSKNRLHGKLPANLSFVLNWNPAIDLSFNSLEGSVPSFFGNTLYLNLSRNSFSGSVSFLCQSSMMLGIDLSHNNFSGKLPDCFRALLFVHVLDLSNNSFFGQLPASLGNLTYLQSLHLGNNRLSGKLPVSLCNFTWLFSLDLGDNLFSGEIPRCLASIQNSLTVVSLRNNVLSGSIPSQLCQPSIQILDLSMNNISGVIPECLCNLRGMTQKKSAPVVIYDSNGTFSTIGAPYKDYISLVLKGYLYNDANHLELVKSLDLSSNNLRGKIPDGISCLTGLVFLNFSGNNLTGSITSKIGNLKSLESLDFSNNHLSGEIPSTISELNFLGTLRLANNNLSGKVPTGTQIQGFNASVFAGNPRLCGDPLPNKCPGDRDRDEQEDGVSEDDDALDLGLYISIALGFITGFWAICGGLVLNRSWRVVYFRFLSHTYDRLYVFVNLKVLRHQI